MDHKKYYIGFDNLYQGYLVILKEENSARLLIQSDGSWLLWNSPEEAIEDSKNVTSHSQQYKHGFDDKSIKASPATWKDIVSGKWDKYVINKPEK